MNDETFVNPCYCLKFRRISNIMTNYYDKMLADSGITITQYSILLNLSHASGCSMSELASISERDRSTIARNIKPLLRDGYVLDDKSPDARDSRLTLTEKGTSTLKHARSAWNRAQEKISKTLGNEGIQTIEYFSKKLDEI